MLTFCFFEAANRLLSILPGMKSFAFARLVAMPY
jgi:hypothetical protein